MELKPQALLAKIQELEAAGKRVKMFVHINPSNPAGVIYDKADMAELAAILRDRVDYVIDDTAYYGLELVDKKPVPVASFPGMQEKTITIVTPSKVYSCIGARTAIAVANEKVIMRINNASVDMSEGVPVFSFAYLVGTYAKEFSRERAEYLEANKYEYMARRDLAYGMINGWQHLTPHMRESVRIACRNYKDEPSMRAKAPFIKDLLKSGLAGVKCTHLPEAGYYHIFDFSAYKNKFFGRQRLETSMDLAKVLAQDAGMVVIPGQMSLFPKGDLIIRISYALEPAMVVEGLGRIKNTLQKLRDTPNSQIDLIWPPISARDKSPVP